MLLLADFFTAQQTSMFKKKNDTLGVVRVKCANYFFCCDSKCLPYQIALTKINAVVY